MDPGGEQQRHRHRAAQRVRHAAQRKGRAIGRKAAGQREQAEGRPGERHRQRHAHFQTQLFVVAHHKKQRQKGAHGADLDKGGELGVGKAVLRENAGLEHGEGVREQTADRELQQGTGPADHPCVMDLLHCETSETADDHTINPKNSNVKRSLAPKAREVKQGLVLFRRIW